MSRSDMEVEIHCPGCNSWISFWNTHSIEVNIESDGVIHDGDMNFLIPLNGCQNPLCEWSKVNIK